MGSTDTAAINTGGRLLVVEDEFLVRLTLTEALVDAGYEVLEAADADEALQHLTAESGPPIRLLLTDVQLPGPVNGHALAARARRILPDLPVIFMTGRPDPGDQTSGARHDVFIAKPYLPSEVCAAVDKILRA